MDYSATAIPLMSRTQATEEPTIKHRTGHRDATPSRSSIQLKNASLRDQNRSMHLLLLMTWLLPLVAPVLAVWIRTLMTAGLTVPFDGDHNFLKVAPFLLLVDSISSRRVHCFEERYVDSSLQYSFR